MDKINFSHLPINSKKQKEEVPLAVVDKIADELVADFSNPEFRTWYCGVIYEFGPTQVLEWQARSKEGTHPGKLFSSYIKSARNSRSLKDFGND